MIKRRDPFDEFAFLIRNETATSLGLSGKALEKALRELAAFDGGQACEHRAKSRDRLVTIAADALHALLVQKELNNIADNLALHRAYAIPDEVWRALGYANTPE